MITLNRSSDQADTRQLLAQNACRLPEQSQPPSSELESESSPRVETTGHVKGVRFAIGVFVLFSFAALFFCGWILWTKCHGH